MAYNLIAESRVKLDFDRIHKALYKADLPFELFPMPKLGLNGGDAIGICVPLKNANEITWRLLKPVLKKLKWRFKCDVHDLYGGQKLGIFNVESFRKNFLS